MHTVSHARFSRGADYQRHFSISPRNIRWCGAISWFGAHFVCSVWQPPTQHTNQPAIMAAESRTRGLVIVTGASGGIGAAIAKAFSDKGHPVLALARRVGASRAFRLPTTTPRQAARRGTPPWPQQAG